MTDAGTAGFYRRVLRRVTVITLNRPRHRDAPTARLILGLRAAMAEADDAIGTVIVTGADCLIATQDTWHASVQSGFFVGLLDQAMGAFHIS